MTRPLILPPLRRTAADAERFARIVHEGQTDRAGRPYVEHLERVAKSACRKALKCGFALHGVELDNVLQIAWLHDAIEDTEVTTRDLQKEGFGDAVTVRVGWLTKDAHVTVPYSKWINYLCKNAELPVLIVKLADMEDNADPARLALLPDEVRSRLERKYGPALEMLRAEVGRRMS